MKPILPKDSPAVLITIGELDPATLDRDELYSAYCDLCTAGDYINDIIGDRDAAQDKAAAEWETKTEKENR